MRNLIAFLFSFLMITALSQTVAQPKASKEPPCKVKISFGSIGTGIDGKAYDAIKKLIDEKKLKFTEKNVGREGESIICMPLTELKKAKKTELINQLKKIAADAQLVSVSIN